MHTAKAQSCAGAEQTADEPPTGVKQEPEAEAKELEGAPSSQQHALEQHELPAPSEIVPAKNHLSSEVSHALRKHCFDFTRADAALRALGVSNNLKGRDRKRKDKQAAFAEDASPVDKEAAASSSQHAGASADTAAANAADAAAEAALDEAPAAGTGAGTEGAAEQVCSPCPALSQSVGHGGRCVQCMRWRRLRWPAGGGGVCSLRMLLMRCHGLTRQDGCRPCSAVSSCEAQG